MAGLWTERLDPESTSCGGEHWENASKHPSSLHSLTSLLSSHIEECWMCTTFENEDTLGTHWVIAYPELAENPPKKCQVKTIPPQQQRTNFHEKRPLNWLHLWRLSEEFLKTLEASIRTAKCIPCSESSEPRSRISIFASKCRCCTVKWLTVYQGTLNKGFLPFEPWWWQGKGRHDWVSSATLCCCGVWSWRLLWWFNRCSELE